eukprot:TRINITY_DN38948_c0_g1_i1.p2 TRINITY_DN38948_c0_g1~~TRINITY_DN38948_c0_g1_i1.p2  ORF type:complete len:147 (+),score=12.90 TRINITY_DN38948_c0_g1_i1:84-524(+)
MPPKRRWAAARRQHELPSEIAPNRRALDVASSTRSRSPLKVVHDEALTATAPGRPLCGAACGDGGMNGGVCGPATGFGAFQGLIAASRAAAHAGAIVPILLAAAPLPTTSRPAEPAASMEALIDDGWVTDIPAHATDGRRGVSKRP